MSGMRCWWDKKFVWVGKVIMYHEALRRRKKTIPPIPASIQRKKRKCICILALSYLNDKTKSNYTHTHTLDCVQIETVACVMRAEINTWTCAQVLITVRATCVICFLFGSCKLFFFFSINDSFIGA